jgi:methionyl-tRNA formyltransferase
MDGYRVAGVFTQPDRACGRGKKIEPSAVKRLALSRGVEIFQPATLKDPVIQDTIRSLEVDIIVVMAYGQILPRIVLDIPKYGALNIHASILPRHRGAAPIQWAIIEGDEETGVSLMKMDAGLDTGDVLSIMTMPIAKGDSASDLSERISHLGARMLRNDLPRYTKGLLKSQKQNESLATYAVKIDKSHGLIDWGMSAIQILRRLRAFEPWPGIYTYLPSKKKRLLKIQSAKIAQGSGSPGQILRVNGDGIEVATGTGALLLVKVQREGGITLSVKDFINGCSLSEGDFLGH